MTTVSPELMRNTGGWALLNQPHWVVSSVAGRRCTFFPSGTGTICSFGSAGPIGGTAWVGGAAGAGCCCARMAVAGGGQAPTPLPARGGQPNKPHPLTASPPLTLGDILHNKKTQ